MDLPVVAVVMAGGTGTRLYPASRSDRPKQFLSFGAECAEGGEGPEGGQGTEGSGDSLLARTVERCAFADEVVVLTGERYADAVHDHAPEATVLVEPAPRDTGPALVYAAHHLRETLGECVLLNLPSDHVVGDGFRADARRAAEAAVETGGLVTLGIEPTRPATEYGYVEPAGDDPGAPGGSRPVAQFREKPDEATARELVDRGCYWNAGMFAWTPGALLAAARDSPLGDLVAALDGGLDDGGASEDEAFAAVEAVSVDHAVLERAEDVHVVPATFDWDDLGSWDALGRVLAPDEDGNVALGESLAVDAAGNVLASDDGHVSVVGVDDLVVAAFDDRVLVVPREEAQRVREVVAALREADRF